MNEPDTGQPNHALQSAPPPARRPNWQRWGLRLLVAALIYTAAGFWVLPLIARSVATSQLRKHLDRDASIAKLRFNPYTFVIEIHGLDIRDRDGQLLAGWDRARVDFQFTSVFYGPWRLKQIRVDQPRARVQINPDYSYNFSDLLEKSADEAPSEPKEPGPLPPLKIDAVQIVGATFDFTDLTPTTPFRRVLGPLDLHVPDFSTLPGYTNQISLQGTTDAGEQFAWASQLWLDPLRLTGSLTLDRLQLTNYAALYQDFTQVQLHGGTIGLHASHDLVFDPARKVARLTDQRFTLAGLRIGLPEAAHNLVELDLLSIETPLLDVWERQATVQDVRIDGVRVTARRLANADLELVEVAQPPPTADRPPGTALVVFDAFNHIFALFAGSTNAAVATVHNIVLTNSAVALIDEAAPRPAHASITDLTVGVRNLSNLPDATPAASLSFRWQTNGFLNLKTAAALTPPAANLELEVRDFDLGVLDAYLANQLNVSLIDSRFNLSGKGWIEAPPDLEPTGRFAGRLALEHLHTAHALEDHDLLTWDAFRIDGIDVNLHPLEVSLDRVELAGLQLWAILNPNGTLNLLTAANIEQPLVTPAGQTPPPPAEGITSDPAPSAETADPNAPNTAPLPPVRLASFLLTNATINLLDRMVDPPMPITLTNVHGELSQLSTTNLQHANFEFRSHIRSGGTVALQGRLRPFDSSDVTTARITINDLELTPGSPYAARFLGYRLDRGKLTTDLNYQITGGQLQATNHVVLDRLTLGARVDSPDALQVPIKLGLAVLQDRQGRIDLTIPVSGSLDDPQFSLVGVIRGAFANVFTRVLTSPFSMLGSMFGGRDDENLQELEFQPGSTDLERRSVSRLKKLEDILYQRPGLQLLIHAGADPQTDNTPALRKERLFDRLRQTSAPTTDTPTDKADPGTAAASFSEAEYRAAVENAYLETQDTPEPSDPAPTDDTPPEPTDTSVKPVTPPPAETRRAPRRSLRGGEIMMLNRLRNLAQPTPTASESMPLEPPLDTLEPEEPPTATLPPFEQMEQLLLNDLELTPDDWHHLARARAELVRNQLLASNRIGPDRIIIPDDAGPPPIAIKARLELQ